MTPRSFFSGLWRGLDGLRKVLHLIVLLAIFVVLVGVLRAGVPRIPARAALLTAQADEIYLDPMGFVLLDGYDRYRTYLKDALDKLGVDINVFRVGAFKSAVETYTRTSMSPEDREESRSYLNALWSSYQQAVTRARKLPADALTKYVATLAKTVPAAGGDAPQVALQAGVVTRVQVRPRGEGGRGPGAPPG